MVAEFDKIQTLGEMYVSTADLAVNPPSTVENENALVLETFKGIVQPSVLVDTDLALPTLKIPEADPRRALQTLQHHEMTVEQMASMDHVRQICDVCSALCVAGHNPHCHPRDRRILDREFREDGWVRIETAPREMLVYEWREDPEAPSGLRLELTLFDPDAEKVRIRSYGLSLSTQKVR